MKDLIQKLVEAWGPSGFEHHLRDLIIEEVRDIASEIHVDALGNLICRVGELGEGGQRVMVAAHMDEIGVMISHIDRQGYLRFTNIGGVFPHTLYGGRVKFEDGTIGVVSVEHAWSNRKSLPDLSGFYIDVSNGEEDAPIPVGSPAIFWRTMDERGSRLISKSMDDRIGCAVAIAGMRRLHELGGPNEVYFVFTVQEEVGLRGATTAAYAINPHVGFALDVTGTGDMPKGMKMDVKLGAGTAIKVLDGKHIAPPAIKNLMIETAEANNIPYQLEILTGGTTDAAAIQLTQSGVPAGTISIPCRNVHTVSETVDISDVQASVDLLAALLSGSLEGLAPV